VFDMEWLEIIDQALAARREQHLEMLFRLKLAGATITGQSLDG